MHPLFSSSRSFVAVLVFWLAICVCVALLLATIAKPHISSSVYASSFTLVMPWYSVYLFFCFSNFYVSQRLTLDNQSVLIAVTGQLSATLVSVALWLGIGFFWSGEMAIFGLDEGRTFFSYTLIVNGLLGGMLYITWIMVHLGYLTGVEREKNLAHRLQRELLINAIEFNAIKAAVHPHFMYNSLNTLANLSLIAPEKIHSMCVQMADFLRYSVNYAKKSEVTLGDELSHIKNYLAVEQERFTDNLRVEFHLEDSALQQRVFPLLLFPLVENSIKHGIGSSTEKGFIRVCAQCREQKVVVTVTNSFDPTGIKAQSTGIGLTSLRKRMEAHYGSLATLTVAASDTVFTVEIVMPHDPVQLVTHSPGQIT